MERKWYQVDGIKTPPITLETAELCRRNQLLVYKPKYLLPEYQLELITSSGTVAQDKRRTDYSIAGFCYAPENPNYLTIGFFNIFSASQFVRRVGVLQVLANRMAKFVDKNALIEYDFDINDNPLIGNMNARFKDKTVREIIEFVRSGQNPFANSSGGVK